MLGNIFGHAANDACVENRIRLAIVKRRDRHAPRALPRDAPVWPRLDRALDPVPTPGRHPFHVLGDGPERPLAERRRPAGGRVVDWACALRLIAPAPVSVKAFWPLCTNGPRISRSLSVHAARGFGAIRGLVARFVFD